MSHSDSREGHCWWYPKPAVTGWDGGVAHPIRGPSYFVVEFKQHTEARIERTLQCFVPRREVGAAGHSVSVLELTKMPVG